MVEVLVCCKVGLFGNFEVGLKVCVEIVVLVIKLVDMINVDVMVCRKVEGLVCTFVGLTKVVALDTVVCTMDCTMDVIDTVVGCLV